MHSPNLEDMMCQKTYEMCFFGHLYADNSPALQQYSILTPTGILELIRGKNNFIKNHISDLGLYE